MALSVTSSYVNTPVAVLAADVANAGTLTISYPTGYAQADFTGGNAGNTADNMLVFRPSGDKYTGTQVGITFGASNITITNNSGTTWSATPTGGSLANSYQIGLPRLDPVQRYNGPHAIV